MRLTKLVIETASSTIDSSGSEITQLTSGDVKVTNSLVFVIQKIESVGGNIVSAKNLSVSNINNLTGPITFTALISGHKSSDHLNEVNLSADILLIAEGK